ncbi:hypothetical protein JL107_04160 [Nakamurella flavida]|uniref:Uncharacterized protein n=1 Tax=Nakamurella flavida TaxID=363630 RepID=A0A939C1N1_9ACTN|nr:hypothetical protein [Nakamurella flavida]MBM9475635.1 hypothetical protein [Nakamurella flavida]MDP9778089.1 hypothetical protein [Nakamurella flavida]
MTQGPGQYGGQDPWAGDPASAQAWGAQGWGEQGWGEQPVPGAGQEQPSAGQPGRPGRWDEWPGPHTGQHPGAHPGQPYPGGSSPAQPYPGQQFPGHAHPGQHHLGEQYPGEQYPGQAYPGQAWPGYGPTGGWTGYPAPGPAYPAPVRPFRPGGVTAAAVLAFVQSGLLLFAGLFVLAGADVAGVVQDSGSGLDDEFTVVALLTWLATGLLIAGGAQVLNGPRGILIGGCALSLALSVYWLVRILGEVAVRGVVAWPFLFAVLPIISISMISTGAVRHWSATVASVRG